MSATQVPFPAQRSVDCILRVWSIAAAESRVLQPLLGAEPTSKPSIHLRHVTSIIRIASACHSVAIFHFLIVAPIAFVGLVGTP